VTRPKLIVLDEPTSALPPGTEADILRVLRGLQDELSLAYILISHDLNLVGQFCDQIAVMYLSQIVELGPRDEVFGNSRHPYTQALMAAALRPDPKDRRARARRLERLGGEIPSPIDLPEGCYFASRCRHAVDRCRQEEQTLELVQSEHAVRCWMADEGRVVERSVAHRSPHGEPAS
jgi:oligopeptide/dipeptide ABC transporter ATP-binding protein